jgi:Protein of unknown function (DUF732)
LVALIVIGTLASNGKHNGTAAAGSGSTALSAPTTAASSSGPTLTVAQDQFVNDLRNYMETKGVSNSASDAALANLGGSICQVASSGGSASDIAAVLGSKAESDFSMKPAKFVHLAEKDLCPKYLPPPVQVLMRFSGNGIRNSPTFIVGNSATVKYSYDCSGFGSSGNFIADMDYGNQASLNSDDQSVANVLGSGGSSSTVVYPQDPGKPYYLSVNSECSWSIVVKGAP